MGVGAQLDNPLGDSLPCPNACLIASKCESPNLFGDVQGCLVCMGLQDMVGAGPELSVAQHQPNALIAAAAVAYSPQATSAAVARNSRRSLKACGRI